MRAARSAVTREFTKIEGASSWYFPLVWSTVFHVRGAAGKAIENEDGKLPVYENFYLGGMNSIRGFESASISPIDPLTGDKIGGDKMWFANIELIFPLLKDMGINGVLFHDLGNVYALMKIGTSAITRKLPAPASSGFPLLAPSDWHGDSTLTVKRVRTAPTGTSAWEATSKLLPEYMK